MKNQLLTISFLLLSVLFSEAWAQNYQPFRKGPTYHFISQDSVFSIRIDSAKVVNGDSAFVFNQSVKKVSATTGLLCGQGMAIPQGEVRPDNHFGYKMLKKANGEFVFLTTNNQEFTLKVKAAVGQSWNFSANPAITATLTSRNVEPVLTLSDSVLTFTLSNGSILKLSKNYGFLKTVNFVSYADASFRLRTFDFYALPEKGLGQEISNPLKIFDFQPGDEFGYYEVATQNSGTCAETWTRIFILARTASTTGISYLIRREVLHKTYGSPGAPHGFCPGQTGHTQLTTTETLNITPNSFPVTGMLTGSYHVPANQQGIIRGSYSTGIFRNSNYNQRMQTGSVDYQFCPNLNMFVTTVDPAVTNNWYGVGLGLTKRTYYNYPTTTINVLECYTKGSETYGNCLSFAQILASKEEIPSLPFSISPNPFTSEITLQLNPELHKGAVEVSLKNVLGQEVCRKTLIGRDEIKLSVPELSNGIYVVQISQAGKTFTQKLVRE